MMWVLLRRILQHLHQHHLPCLLRSTTSVALLQTTTTSSSRSTRHAFAAQLTSPCTACEQPCMKCIGILSAVVHAGACIMLCVDFQKAVLTNGCCCAGCCSFYFETEAINIIYLALDCPPTRLQRCV